MIHYRNIISTNISNAGAELQFGFDTNNKQGNVSLVDDDTFRPLEHVWICMWRIANTLAQRSNV